HVVVLPGDPGRDDVRVVAARHGHEGSVLGGRSDPGLLERVAVEADADDGLGLKAGREAVERLGALVDDRDRVSGFGELNRKGRAHSSASEDDHVHGGKTNEFWKAAARSREACATPRAGWSRPGT